MTTELAAVEAAKTVSNKEQKALDRVFITASQLLSTDDRLVIEFESKWGWIRLKQLSAEDGIELAKIAQGPARHTGDVITVMKSMVDENGRPLLTQDQLNAFKSKSLHAFNEILEECLKLNKLGQYSKSAAGEDA